MSRELLLFRKSTLELRKAHSKCCLLRLESTTFAGKVVLRFEPLCRISPQKTYHPYPIDTETPEHHINMSIYSRRRCAKPEVSGISRAWRARENQEPERDVAEPVNSNHALNDVLETLKAGMRTNAAASCTAFALCALGRRSKTMNRVIHEMAETTYFNYQHSGCLSCKVFEARESESQYRVSL